MRTHLLVFLFIMALLIMFGWWVQDRLRPETRIQLRVQNKQADYIVDTFASTGMDDLGKPRYRLDAEKVFHYEYEDRAELIKPSIELIARKGSPWMIRSELGVIHQQGELVTLKGNVYISRTASENNRPIQIETSELTVKPEQQYLSTDQQAIISSGASKIQGVGMRANLKDPKLTLLSQVRGIQQIEKATP